MSKRITVNNRMHNAIYAAIHDVIMEQRLRVAKEDKFSVDVAKVDKVLFELTDTIHQRVLLAMRVG